MKGSTFAFGSWVAAALALTGCGHVESRSIPFGRLDPRPAAAAEVYADRGPGQPYEELGLVQAVGTGSQANKQAVLRALRAQGRHMGCDAIVNANAQTGELSSHAIGVCVRWVHPKPVDAVAVEVESP